MFDFSFKSSFFLRPGFPLRGQMFSGAARGVGTHACLFPAGSLPLPSFKAGNAGIS